MSHTIAGIDVAFTDANPNFHHWWTDFNPSTQILPKGYRREPDRLALKEDLIWEKDVAIPLRDGVHLRADIFRPAKLDGHKLPALPRNSFDCLISRPASFSVFALGRARSCLHAKVTCKRQVRDEGRWGERLEIGVYIGALSAESLWLVHILPHPLGFWSSRYHHQKVWIRSEGSEVLAGV